VPALNPPALNPPPLGGREIFVVDRDGRRSVGRILNRHWLAAVEVPEVEVRAPEAQCERGEEGWR
jgi:hypothetical protein